MLSHACTLQIWTGVGFIGQQPSSVNLLAEKWLESHCTFIVWPKTNLSWVLQRWARWMHWLRSASTPYQLCDSFCLPCTRESYVTSRSLIRVVDVGWSAAMDDTYEVSLFRTVNCAAFCNLVASNFVVQLSTTPTQTIIWNAQRRAEMPGFKFETLEVSDCVTNVCKHKKYTAI